MLKNENELMAFLNNCLIDRFYDEALQAIEDNFSLINKKYYDICRIKLDCLINLEKYIEASILIKEELSVAYVPLDFEEFLKDRQRIVFRKLNENKNNKVSIDDIEKIDEYDDLKLQKILSSLINFNLNLYVDKFQKIFDNPDISDITKTLLIATLSDYKLDANFTVIKENTTIKFNPKDVYDIRDGENFKQIQQEMKELGKIDVNVAKNLFKMIMTYLLDVYPLVMSEKKTSLVFTACLFLTFNAFNLKLDNQKYIEILANNQTEIQKIIKKINLLIENV